MRVAKAQSELSGYLDSHDEEEWDEGETMEKIRLKYDIPDTVHLFYGEGELTKETAKLYKKHLAAFVRGRLTEDAFDELIFCFEEDAECDYGWIMVERPMGFYRAGGLEISADGIAEIVAEMRSIGTRHPNKLGTLSQVASCLSQMNVKVSVPARKEGE